MRRAGLSFAAAVLCAVCLSAQAVPPQGRDVPATTGTATLDGLVTVTAGGARTPVRRARIVLSTSLGQQVTDTDTNGRFHLDHLAAGRYKVVVNKAGFVPAGRATLVDVAADSHETIAVPMVPGAAIEGRLTTDDGEPAIGLTVSAGQLGYGPYGRVIVATAQAVTDDLGRFRIHTLPAGDYYIEAEPDPIRMMQVSAAEGPNPKPTRTYYNGATTGTSRLNDARIVTLTEAQQASGLDFSVVSNVLATLSIPVRTSAGGTPPSFIVRVQRVGGAAGEVRCLLLPSGPAVCENVPPGDFWVMAAARATPTGPAEYAATRVTVDGRDQTLTETTTPGVSVAGRVETDGAPLPANLRLQVLALETAFALPPPTLGQPTATPSATVDNGAFAFPDLFGPRLLRIAGLPEGWALKAVSLGATDITDTPTTFAPASPITVVLTAQTGAVAGTVTDTAGQPAVGSRVVVFATDGRLWGAHSRYIATTEVGPGGQYALHNLLPGKYLVAAVTDLPEGGWEDPERLAQLQPTAVAVTITAGATAAVDWRPR